jgi:hypothetical protein
MTIRNSFMRSVTTGSLAVVLSLFGQTLAYADESGTIEVFSKYARYGADVWADHPMAKISGEGKACISCHTSMPYGLVEPLLPGSYAAYDDMISNIEGRVRTWSDNTPWYADAKLEHVAGLDGAPPDALKGLLDADDSRGVEAVFNALILAVRDGYADSPASADTEQAFANMWAEQKQTGPEAGRWGWIYANLIPWEVEDSDLWGASLACVATSLYPDQAPEGQLQMLHDTLRQAAGNDEVSLHVKSAVLWCDTETGGQVLGDGVAGKIAADLLEQQLDNGGWALRHLGPWGVWSGSEADCCSQQEIRSDAYATGFVAMSLARSRHLLSDDGEAQLDRAIAWIDKELANPYPAEPRHNRHGSGDNTFPTFRNNIYTNAGHMWSFLAKTVHENESAPWR